MRLCRRYREQLDASNTLATGPTYLQLTVPLPVNPGKGMAAAAVHYGTTSCLQTSITCRMTGALNYTAATMLAEQHV